MTARMVIQGKEVPTVHLLMEEIDLVGTYLDSMPEDHPDLSVWIDRYDGLMADLLKERRPH